jgi:hypothetical protein
MLHGLELYGGGGPRLSLLVLGHQNGHEQATGEQERVAKLHDRWIWWTNAGTNVQRVLLQSEAQG